MKARVVLEDLADSVPVRQASSGALKEMQRDDLLLFLTSLEELAHFRGKSAVIHILCGRGNLSFLHRSTFFNIGPDDYAIMPNAALATDFSASPDLEAIVMALTPAVGSRLALKSNYGIVGHLALLQDPVMRLSKAAAERCRADLLRLRERSTETGHFFQRELLEHLLAAHVLDLYDLHAKAHADRSVPDRAAQLLARFTDALASGAYRTHRDLAWYGEKLCVTPHYLSEVCRRASGRGANYFIDLFTTQEIARRLCDKRESIQAIADDFGFSSVSYFTRYVKKHLGTTPRAFRLSRLAKS